MEKKFKTEKIKIYKYFCEKNKNKNNKNFPTNPSSGGIPDSAKIISIVVIPTKLCLLKIFKLLSVLMCSILYKNNRQKNTYKINTYTYTFI